MRYFLSSLDKDIACGAAEGAGGFTFEDLPEEAPGAALELFPLVFEVSETRLVFFIKYRVKMTKRIMNIIATVTIKTPPTQILPDACVKVEFSPF